MKEMNKEKAVYNQAEAARFLGLSRYRFWQLERAGHFARVPDVSGVFYKRSDLEAFMVADTKTGGDPPSTDG